MILEDSPVPGDKAAHLKPIIDFLIDQGHVPLSSHFTYDKTGIGTFLFKNPIDVKQVEKRFIFNKSIRVGEDPYCRGGIIFDRKHALKVHQVW